MTPAFEVLATSLRLRLGHECGTFGGAGGWQVTAEDAAPWYSVRDSLTCWWGGDRGGEDANFPDALQDVCEHDNPCLQVNWAHDFDYMWEVVNVFIHNCVDFACIDGPEGMQYNMYLIHVYIYTYIHIFSFRLHRLFQHFSTWCCVCFGLVSYVWGSLVLFTMAIWEEAHTEIWLKSVGVAMWILCQQKWRTMDLKWYWYDLTPDNSSLQFYLGGGFIYIYFYVQPYLGKWSILTNIFSNGLKPPTSLVTIHMQHCVTLFQEYRHVLCNFSGLI